MFDNLDLDSTCEGATYVRFADDILRNRAPLPDGADCSEDFSRTIVVFGETGLAGMVMGILANLAAVQFTDRFPNSL